LTGQSWRSDERYASLHQLKSTDLAWEFLRRNPAYQADYQQFQSRGVSGAATAPLGDPMLPWGLTFPGGPRAVGERTAGLLAA
jgi:hypothetical protein